MKKILIITASLRKGSNSSELAAEFARGAKENGNEIEIISLKNKEIKFCKGCFSCQGTEQCVIKDDAAEIVKKMKQADALVFATPIYYYEMSGQMKTMLDRANPLYDVDYMFRDVYLLCTATDDNEQTWQRSKNGLEGWVMCFPKAKLSGVVFGGGVTEAGEIKNHSALKKAYEMGKDS